MVMLTFALIQGCAPQPKVPDIELKGFLEMTIYGIGGMDCYKMNGNFQIKGEKDEITIFLNDWRTMPQGKIVIKNKQVMQKNLNFDPKVIKVMKYWPYIFGWGETRGRIKTKYSHWQDTSKGKFPGETEIKAGEISLYFKIYYED